MLSKRTFLTLSGILLITALILWPVLNNSFTNWDDQQFVTGNPVIKELSLKNILKIFTEMWNNKYNYAPLVIFSFAIEHHFFGLNPTVFHATNLILHLINTALVFVFIYLFTRHLFSAAIVSVLFGIHPLNVEPVAWISQRKDMLFIVFYLSALITYLFHIQTGCHKIRYWLTAYFLFFLALLAKSMAITLPVVLLLIDDYQDRKIDRACLFEKIPFFILSGLSVFVTLTSPVVEGIGNIFGFTIIEKIWLGSFAFVNYLFKLFVPFQLSSYYPHPDMTGAYPLAFRLAPLGVILFGWLAWRGRQNKMIRFGTLFFVLTVFTTLFIGVKRTFIMADRYTYLPAIGIFFILAAEGNFFLQRVNLNRSTVKLFAVIFVGCLLILGFLSRQRCHIWKDSITLWSDVIEKYPRAQSAYLNRGQAYIVAGEYESALQDLNRTIAIAPSWPKAYNDRGILYSKMEEYALAEKDFNKALGLYPCFVAAYQNRARMYALRQKNASE